MKNFEFYKITFNCVKTLVQESKFKDAARGLKFCMKDMVRFNFENWRTVDGGLCIVMDVYEIFLFKDTLISEIGRILQFRKMSAM